MTTIQKHFIAKPTSLLWLFIGLLFTNCDPSTTVKNLNQTTPLLTVIGIDQSETVTNYLPFSVENFEAIQTTMSYDGGVLIYDAIGNPTDRALNRHIVSATQIIDSSADLYDKIEQGNKQQLLQLENQQFFQKHKATFANLTTIRNQKYTDLNGFLNKAKKVLQEPQYKHFKKYLVLYSDGYHDVRQNQQLKCQFETVPNLTICLIGWKNKQSCSGSQIYQFESPQGFMDYFQNRTLAITN